MPKPPETPKQKSAVANMYETRDRMTSEMVRDFAEKKEFMLITHTLYAYGMWLTHHEDAFDHLDEPKPTKRTFSSSSAA